VDRVNLLVTEWMRAKLGVQEYIDAMPEDGSRCLIALEMRRVSP
jgi:hypothetical protein